MPESSMEAVCAAQRHTGALHCEFTFSVRKSLREMNPLILSRASDALSGRGVEGRRSPFALRQAQGNRARVPVELWDALLRANGVYWIQ